MTVKTMTVGELKRRLNAFDDGLVVDFVVGAVVANLVDIGRNNEGVTIAGVEKGCEEVVALDDEKDPEEPEDECANCGAEFDIVFTGTPRTCLDCSTVETRTVADIAEAKIDAFHARLADRATPTTE